MIRYVSALDINCTTDLAIPSVHSGVTAGDIKLTFGCSERVRYKEHFVPMFGAFLKKCYSTCLYLFLYHY